MDKIRVPISIIVDDLTDKEEIKEALKAYALEKKMDSFNPTQIIKVTSNKGSTVQSDTPDTVFILPSTSKIDDPKLNRLLYPTNTYGDVFYSQKIKPVNKTLQQIWDELNPHNNDGDLANEYDVPDGGSLRKKRRKSYSKKYRKVKRKIKKRRKCKTKKRR